MSKEPPPDPNAANPCWHKGVCKKCKKVDLDQRPKLCELLSCEHFTPCRGCGLNRALAEGGLCEGCGGKAAEEIEVGIEKDLAADAADPFTPTAQVAATQAHLIVTPPGVPHPHYTDQEREYYLLQWEQYSGYYRDPSAYPLVHQMIMLELELMVTSNQRRSLLGSDDEKAIKRLESREDALIRNIGNIHNQLPAKEAQEMTDDEKSLAMILDRYVKEKQACYQGGVSRIISPRAVALAPVLHYKLNLSELLRRLGYETIQITQALDRLIKPDELPKDPIKLAEFLGMMVREKIATTDADEEGPPELPEGLTDEDTEPI